MLHSKSLTDRATCVNNGAGTYKMQFADFIFRHQYHSITFNASHFTGARLATTTTCLPMMSSGW